MNYKVVKIQQTDNFDICELYEKAFGQPMCEYNSSEIYLWFYFENLTKIILSFYHKSYDFDCREQSLIAKGLR